MTTEKFNVTYWKYYCSLENRFISTFEYVEPNIDNYPSYSNEYASLIQAIGAELDSVFKLYCGFGCNERKSISDYARAISDFDSFKSQRVQVINRDIILIPFESWDKKCAAQSLSWWDNFDKIKHNRAENERNANLQTVYNLLAATFLIEVLFYQRLIEKDEYGRPVELDFPFIESKVFSLCEYKQRYYNISNNMYELDGDLYFRTKPEYPNELVAVLNENENAVIS